MSILIITSSYRIPLNAISTLTETITAVARLQVKKLGKLIHPSHVRVQVSHLECFFDNLVLISQSIVIAASCRQKYVIYCELYIIVCITQIIFVFIERFMDL